MTRPLPEPFAILKREHDEKKRLEELIESELLVHIRKEEE